MEIETELDKERPKERRKTYTRIAYIADALITLFLTFIGFCLYVGKEQFLIELIKVSLYPILTFAGYYAGTRKRKTKKKKKEDFTPAEVVVD
ncbi:hypothetical protein KK083_16975 [Fulvivirgaceae bacterium PWU4]|uniref:Uncharacterized protein n=1 Tax=Chryseosolibacter histidini TaxID=2782349 RepID=A0AAP2GP14_9BACT|nr:hypothetical protein [Chryseosolibacter histidini]MBT1698588.1 hypothetical protein [Chryseosolibacter histidini]